MKQRLTILLSTTLLILPYVLVYYLNIYIIGHQDDKEYPKLHKVARDIILALSLVVKVHHRTMWTINCGESVINL